MSGNLPAGITETPSGLIVPQSAVARKQRTVTADTMKKLRRLMRDAKDNGLACLWACVECKQPVQAVQVDQIVTVHPVTGEQVGGGRLVLRCPCTEWTVR